MPGVDLIIHLAAEHKDFGVPESLYYQANVDGTEKLLQHAARRQIGIFIFFSASPYTGQAGTDRRNDGAGAGFARDKSKLMAEERIGAWASQAPERKESSSGRR